MMESFNNKRPRCPNWTEQDKVVLVKNIQARKDILFARNKGDYATKEEIAASWQEVLHAVNLESHFPRTLEQVKKQHENLKLRAKQLFMDMQQCTGTVKPHIVTPVMQMMIDDFTDAGNSSSYSLSFDDLSNTSQSHIADKTKVTLKSSPPPPPPLTLSVTSMAGSSIDEDTGSNTDIPNYGQNSDIIRNSGRFNLHNGANSYDSDEYSYPNQKRRKLEDYQPESQLVNIEMEKIRAETEKLKAETELIYQRKECEYAIFDLQRRVLEAKLEYYSKENEKGSVSEQSMDTSVRVKSTKYKSSGSSEHTECGEKTK